MFWRWITTLSFLCSFLSMSVLLAPLFGVAEVRAVAMTCYYSNRLSLIISRWQHVYGFGLYKWRKTSAVLISMSGLRWLLQTSVSLTAGYTPKNSTANPGSSLIHFHQPSLIWPYISQEMRIIFYYTQTHCVPLTDAHTFRMKCYRISCNSL